MSGLLYDAGSDVPVLRGTQCLGCGRVYFPPIGIGCESCGATELVPARLATTGSVFAVATVQLQSGTTPAPFTVAEVLLDAGPLIRALVHPHAGDLRIGTRVTGAWLATDGDPRTVEPAFMPAAGIP